ncbi:hypothetical protein [Pseudobacter ginsenosidimutans]|uniref:PIN domain-containing protein n=1 Tax=Pseudobacter ginsenosidimutans TaxID=661488 RepID=A0A4Q7MWS5_9BACT|nr:hypothetical protein [Pseudobacter ginsenosidimutans]QEC41688.1 hypothetical protein FSB84_08280 [Pseudobacter ginsenosidimutans]RZS71510.1 hypothetical protein EV199_3414 [Pseudobacter ginsenosidimutans]
MAIQFILDTNAYRKLVTGKREAEILPTANEMRIRERSVNCTSLLSITVSMELMRHLSDETDPHFEDCKKALILQYHHTQSNPGGPNNSISFIPPLNEILSEFYFQKSSLLFGAYRLILATLELIAKDPDNNISPEKKNLLAIGSQILHDKKEIRDNFEDFIKSYTGGIVDWTHFKKDKKTKPKILKDIRSGKALMLFNLSMLDRAHSVHQIKLDITNIDPKFQRPLSDFFTFFEPLLVLLQTLFMKMLDGVDALSDYTNPKWNTLNDIQILASACYQTFLERNNGTKVILVTDDQGIHAACKNTYMEDNVWTVSRYLAHVY